ncbi:MAG TPA: vanadium-dependent haloperoxidase, partial [Herpetosiphonaceae bacterium]
MSAVPPSDAAFFWNDVLLEAMLTDSRIPIATNREQDGPTRHARAAAIVHVAMHDAVNGVSRRFLPYLIQERAPSGASADAAAAAAAHATLTGLYPSQTATLFDPKLIQYLNSLPAGPSRDQGVQFGTEVGYMLLMARQQDGRNLPEPPYLEKPTPGEYRADPIAPAEPVLTPGWGAIRPFTLSYGAQLRPVPYPLMTTGAYTTAFNEVKTRGSVTAHTPPTEETEIAQFWSYDDLLGTPVRLYNQHVRSILTEHPRSAPSAATTILHVHARIFALVNLALADAGIACWEAKYAYNFWRPIHGIRHATQDNNPNTAEDGTWRPLGRPRAPQPNKTPPFPAYVSGHSSLGTAAFAMLRKVYGTNTI